MKLYILVILSAFMFSCSFVLPDKHLKEKVFTSNDIKVRWYEISELTSVHDFIDVERNGNNFQLIKANIGGIYNIEIEQDTITVYATKTALFYDFVGQKNGCYIRLDTSVTDCAFMKKFNPDKALYCH